MKPDIHPKSKIITVQFPKGGSFEALSTYSGGDTLFLDVDFRNHPAWTGKGVVANASNAKVSQFNQKFGGFDFSSSTKSTSDSGDSSSNS